MKLKFKDQQFQIDATAAVCDVFEGQPYHDPTVYTLSVRRTHLGPRSLRYGGLVAEECGKTSPMASRLARIMVGGVK